MFVYLFYSIIDRKNKFQEGIQSIPEIKKQIQKISTTLSELAAEINSLQAQKQPIKDRLLAAIKEKDDTKHKNKNTIKAMSTKLDAVKTDNTEIQRLTKELAVLEQLDLSNAIKNLKKSFETVDKNLKEKVSFQISIQSYDNLQKNVFSN